MSKTLRVLMLLWLGAMIGGCSTIQRETPGPDARPLAGQWPSPDSLALLEYSEYWCARSAAERAQRRAMLAPQSDRVELMLLEYCDLAHPDAPRTARAPAGDRLARWDPRATAAELAYYQQYWCERDSAERKKRRGRLAARADELELLLLDYCDNARRAPRALATRLEAIQAKGSWPADYAPWFAWLQWHLRNFDTATAEATARQQHMQRTIDQLRAIERDMSSRDDTSTGGL